MSLSEKQKKHLRGLAHSRKPVVMISDGGLSEPVRLELETALAFHELIKVSVRCGDHARRAAIVEQIATDFRAEAVQRVGNMAVFYRHNPKRSRIKLPAGGD